MKIYIVMCNESVGGVDTQTFVEKVFKSEVEASYFIKDKPNTYIIQALLH